MSIIGKDVSADSVRNLVELRKDAEPSDAARAVTGVTVTYLRPMPLI
jgi:hypothetical protein